jgi:hypothetical protein
MARIGATLRILALLLCLVPLASARPAGGASAPQLPAVPAAPENEAPAPPNKEDDERETADAKERPLAHSRQQIDMLPLPLASRTSPAPGRPSSLRDADPFRNGLGSPYRC